jgi:hypothetical protein
MAKRKISRSAETGEIVSKETAKKNPKETVTQTVEVKPKPKVKPAVPQLSLNTKYLFTHKESGTESVVEITSFDPFTVTEFFIKNLCQSESSYELVSPEKYDVRVIGKDELALRLT